MSSSGMPAEFHLSSNCFAAVPACLGALQTADCCSSEGGGVDSCISSCVVGRTSWVALLKRMKEMRVVKKEGLTVKVL